MVANNGIVQYLIYQLRGNEWTTVEFFACIYDETFTKRLVDNLGCEAVNLATSDTADYCEYKHFNSTEVIDHFSYGSVEDDENDDIGDDEDPWLDVDKFLKDQCICIVDAEWHNILKYRSDRNILISDETIEASEFIGMHRIFFNQ